MNKHIKVYMGFWACIHLFSLQSLIAQDRPNILWISWEDVSPNFACYGDSYAITPAIDALAKEGVTYTQAFSHSGVCAPSRAGIITGMYPTATGMHHMRVRGLPPAHVKLFPEYLRRAGYYCTNDVKTDYQTQFSPEIPWDEQGRGVRWHKRSSGQPFFSVVNFTTPHEGQIYRQNAFWEEELAQLDAEGIRHDPDKAPLPPYFPDHPTVRKDVARYYDNMTVTDKLTQQLLDQLEEEGLLENTIIFFWGDHGAGLTRGKRWVYDSGLQFPLIVRVPERYRDWVYGEARKGYLPGSKSDELVGFVDFAPTVLSLAGVEIPSHIHGQAFLGPQKSANPRTYIYAGRDRMDEVYDVIRAVRDKKYKYIRNYLPHLPYSQTLRTMERMPTLQVMRKLHAKGKLNETQALFFAPRKPIEELYDIEKDPHEVHNLATDSAYREVLLRLRTAHRDWQKRVGDVGMIPEPIIDAWRSPNGYWQTTQQPLISLSNQPFLDGKTVVSLSCPTPGASIAWRRKGETNWRLYDQAFVLNPNGEIETFAARLGYYPSTTRNFQLGQVPAIDSTESSLSFWMDQLDDPLMEAIYQLKDLDFMGAEAFPQFIRASKDKRSVITYWAAIGLYGFAQNSQQKEQVIPHLEALLTHPEPVVRITAAHALADWGDSEPAILVLKKALTHSLESVRLTSALALDKLGDKAQAVLPFPEIVPGTENQYANRVFLRMLKKWK